MNIFKSPFATTLFAILIITSASSCSKVYFDTQQQTSTLDNAKNISSHEVSIGEWITYVKLTP